MTHRLKGEVCWFSGVVVLPTLSGSLDNFVAESGRRRASAVYAGLVGNVIGNARSIEILLVEDSPGDVRLTIEALKDGKVRNNLSVVGDGEEALLFLRRVGKYADAPAPDLILLDLNLPKKDGREVLADIKADPVLKRIPVVVLTTSTAEQDVLRSYDLHANCYITKPVDLDQFISVIRTIEDFWLAVVTLPPA